MDDEEQVECPVLCGVFLPKSEIQDHLLECNLQPVTCKYYALGCTDLVPRGKLSSHYDNNVQSHLGMLDTHYQTLLRRLHESANRNVMPFEIFQWDVGSLHCIYTMKAHTRPVLCMKIVNGQLVSGSEDETLVLWDVAKGRKKGVLGGVRGGVHCIESTPSGLVVSGHDDGSIHIWDINLQSMVNTLPVVHKESITSVVHVELSRNAHLQPGIADSAQRKSSTTAATMHSSTVGTSQGKLDIEINSSVATAEEETIGGIPKKYLLQGANSFGTSSTEGATATNKLAVLFSASTDGTIGVWRMETNELITRLKAHEGGVSSMVYISPLLYSSGSDSTIKAFDTTRPAFPVVQTMQGAHTGPITSLICMKMDLVVSAGVDSLIGVWSTVEGRLLTTLDGHESAIMALTRVTEDVFVSASKDHTFKVWSVNMLTCLKTMPCPAISLAACDFFLFTGGTMNTVKVWTSEGLTLNHKMIEEPVDEENTNFLPKIGPP